MNGMTRGAWIIVSLGVANALVSAGLAISLTAEPPVPPVPS